jgi:hypothetical protein
MSAAALGITECKGAKKRDDVMKQTSSGNSTSKMGV